MRPVRFLGIAGALLTVWWLIGPSQFGGPTTFVSTFGVSMLPRVQAGDLIVARRSPSYRVGEVGVYTSDELNVVVAHRIIDVTPDGRYVFKGDNNSWLDPDPPTVEAIKGKEWIHIPQGGIWLKRLASPAVVGGIAFFILWWSTSVSAVHRPRRRRRQTMGVAPHKPRAVK